MNYFGFEYFKSVHLLLQPILRLASTFVLIKDEYFRNSNWFCLNSSSKYFEWYDLNQFPSVFFLSQLFEENLNLIMTFEWTKQQRQQKKR